MSLRSSAATEQIQGQGLEIALMVSYEETNAFWVHRNFYDPEQSLKDSILLLDYNYTPWPRCGGDLLWNQCYIPTLKQRILKSV